MAANWVTRAARGEPPFARPIHADRIVAPMNVGPLFFIARADAAIRTRRRSRRLSASSFGPEKSGMAQHAHVILGALGYRRAAGPSRFRRRAPPRLTPARPMRSCNARSQPGHDRALPSASPARAALWRGTARARPRGRSALPAAIVPARRSPGSMHDVAQPAVLNLLVDVGATDPAMVAATAQAIAAHAAAIERRNPAVPRPRRALRRAAKDGRSDTRRDGVALHPGAARAYRDLGLLA